jgi:RNA polymerase sigma-70 factor (ECF subfamily)
MADTEIIVMGDLKDGNTSSFERLITKYEKNVFNVIYRFMGRTSDADDLSQEVFLRVWKSAPTWEPSAKFSTWLYRITANLCLSALRDRKRGGARISIDAAAEDAESDAGIEVEDTREDAPSASMSREELAGRVKKVIAELPESQRMAVILSRFEEQSYEEIAEAMEITVAAVKSLLSRARENIRRKLAPFVARQVRDGAM